jgi:hypothetical protein
MSIKNSHSQSRTPQPIYWLLAGVHNNQRYAFCIVVTPHTQIQTRQRAQLSVSELLRRYAIYLPEVWFRMTPNVCHWIPVGKFLLYVKRKYNSTRRRWELELISLTPSIYTHTRNRTFAKPIAQFSLIWWVYTVVWLVFKVNWYHISQSYKYSTQPTFPEVDPRLWGCCCILQRVFCNGCGKGWKRFVVVALCIRTYRHVASRIGPSHRPWFDIAGKHRISSTRVPFWWWDDGWKVLCLTTCGRQLLKVACRCREGRCGEWRLRMKWVESHHNRHSNNCTQQQCRHESGCSRHYGDHNCGYVCYLSIQHNYCYWQIHVLNSLRITWFQKARVEGY